MEKRKSKTELTYNFSCQTVKAIRNAFFDTIVSLFIEYQQFISDDDDGETTFQIQKFIDSKNDNYRGFYSRFFPNPTQVENQMFMNFLNLQHMGEVDELQQLKKEHFDRKANEILQGLSPVNVINVPGLKVQ